MDSGVLKSNNIENILHEEWKQYLSRRRSSQPSDWRHRLTGLAISGGGIRSAAFSLGVLQHLAAKKLLVFFDYLSTVSGGSYIGGSLSYFLNHPAFDSRSPKYDLECNFPYGDPDKSWHLPTPELNYLRSHGNYLAPSNSINIRSFIGVVMRAVLLNLIIWLPVLIMVMAVMQRLILVGQKELFVSMNSGPALSLPWLTDTWALTGLGVAVLSGICGLITLLKLKTLKDLKKIRPWKKIRFISWLISLTGAWLFSCRVIVAGPKLTEIQLITESDTWRDRVNAVIAQIPEFWVKEVPLLFKLFEAAVLGLGLLFLLLILFYSLSTVLQKDQTEYRRRRLHNLLYGIILKWLPICAAVALVPYLSKLINLSGGIGALVVGIAVGLWKVYQRGREWIPFNAAVPIAAVLILYGLSISAYSFAYKLDSASSQWVLYIVLLAAVFLGYCVNLNHISVGRYYRDRLMEAFMPSEDMIRTNENRTSPGANTFVFSDIAGTRRSPYHLVNTNVVLVDSSDKEVKQRGGDSFVFSPLFTGSKATGWIRSDQYCNNEFTLATAVSASAAAVNPHAGPAGRGLSRNRAVSMLMALLNLRLGYWAPNPRHLDAPTRMNHFWAGWYELSPNAGYREDSTFVHLSDGGHFDNLGLYELFRRKLRFILVLDGGADKDFGFEDLQNALHRAEQDFKVHIKFNRPIGDLIPQKQHQVKFPEGLKLADTGYISGRFTYGPNDPQPPGWIFYIKTTLIKNMSMRTRGYKGAKPSFPDETTVDQFFDEDQFDAYRLLGDEIAKRLTKDWHFKKWLMTYSSDQPIETL
jgi:hypothetical protein